MFMVRPRTDTVTETLSVVHHLHFPDETAARDAAELAEMLGWTLEAPGPQPLPFRGWLVRLSQVVATNDVTLEASRGVLVGLAREGAGTYVGWDPRHAQRQHRVAS